MDKRSNESQDDCSKRQKTFLDEMLEMNEDTTKTWISLYQAWDTIGRGADQYGMIFENVGNNLHFLLKIKKMMYYYSGGYESDSYSSEGKVSIVGGSQYDDSFTINTDDKNVFTGEIKFEDFKELVNIRKDHAYISFKDPTKIPKGSKLVDYFYGGEEHE